MISARSRRDGRPSPRTKTTTPNAIDTTVSRLLEAREPVYQSADLTIASRDVPHDRIVDECLEALRARLCTQERTDGMSVTP